MATLHNLVQENIPKHSTSVAVAYDDGNFKSYVTYQELFDRTEVISGLLRSLDVDNETIGLCMPQNLDLPAVILAILQTPASFYPFDGDGPEFVHQSLVKLRVRYLLVHFDHLQSVDKLTHILRGEVVPCMELLEFGLVLISVPTSDQSSVQSTGQSVKQTSDLAYCITTSGTTSSPKVVRVPHQCIVPNITHLRSIYKVTRDDVCFLSSPLTFDPSIVEMFVALTSGATLLITSNEVKTSPKKLLEVLYHRNSVSVLQTTPALLFRSNLSALQSTLFSSNSSLRLLALGGEKFPSIDVLKRVVSLDSHVKFVNLYGITEVSTWATYFAFDAEYIWKTKQEIPLGSRLSCTKVKVVDAEGHEVMNGEGEFMIGSSTRCCLLNDETPEDVLKQETWRHTGDIVFKSEDGVITYIGRSDGQIKRLGKRLNTEAIEHAVLQLSKVAYCKVLQQQNHLLLFLVARQPITEVHHATFKMEVTSHLQKLLPSHYQPDELILTESFPVTKHGKTDVKLLISHWMSAHKVKVKRTEDVWLWCQELWMDILRPQTANPNLDKEVFSVTDKSEFLALGGDSLKAVNLVNDVEWCYDSTRPSLLDTVLNGTFKDFVEDIQNLLGQREEEKLLSPQNNFDLVPGHDKTSGFDIDEQTSEDQGESIIEKEDAETQGEKKPRLSTDSSKSGDSVRASSIGLENPNETSHSKSSDHDEVMGSEYKDSDMSLDADTANDESDDGLSERTVELSSPGVVANDSELIALIKREPVSSHVNTYHGTMKNRSPLEVESPFIGSVSRGNRYQGTISGEATQMISKSPKLEEVWKYDTGKCVDASCLVALTRSGEHVVYIGSHSHAMCAIHLTTGTEMWRTQLGDRIESTPCLSRCGRWVVVGCYDSNLYVLCALSGKLHWKYRTEGCVKSSPTVDPVTSHIIFGSHDHHLHAINVEEKQRVWTSPLQSGSIFSSPCVSQHWRHVYVGTLGGILHAVNADTGKVVWSRSTEKPIFSTPAENRSCVVTGCVDGSIFCFNHEGHKLWTFQTQAPVFSSPTFMTLASQMNVETESEEKDVILVGSHDKHLYCLSQSGELVWQWEADSAIYATPFIGRTGTVAPSEVLQTKKVEKVERSRSLGTLQEKKMEMKVEVVLNMKEPNKYIELSKVTQSEEDLRLQRKESLENKLHFQTEMSNGVTYPLRKIKAKSLSWLDEDLKSDSCGVCAVGNKLVGFDGEPFIKKLKLESEANLTYVCRDCGKKSSKAFQKLISQDDLCTCESKVNSLATNEQEIHSNNFSSMTKDFKVETDVSSEKNAFNLKGPIDESTSSIKENFKIDSNTQEDPFSLMNDLENCLGPSSVTNMVEGHEANGPSPLVCVASTTGQLVLLDGRSGCPVSSVQLPGEVFSSPVIVDGLVVVGCRDDFVYCYRITDSST